MNELQLREFKVLKCFVEICNILDLKYYLVCGSALGAVKYNGFIPWDDDIDVGMPRSDYEIFLSSASSLLPKNFFLQNFKTDPEFPAIYSKLRDSSTTYIEKSSSKLRINHGIYIDIFPLDGYPVDKFSQKMLELKKKIFSHQLATAFELPLNKSARVLNKLLRTLGYHNRTAKTAFKYDKMISKYNIANSELICNHGNWQGKIEYSPVWHYGLGVFFEFEGLKVRIPEKYDEYLTQKYGDWRSDLPDNQKNGHHYYEVCDLNNPYTNYIDF